MNAAQVLITIVGLVSTIVAFCLLRFPHTRRPQFRQYGALSLATSLMGAVIVLAFCLLLVYLQGIWTR
jgi:uncharacterized membrane protein YeaQ/YmgE (transglycosylase-associated protein family)